MAPYSAENDENLVSPIEFRTPLSILADVAQNEQDETTRSSKEPPKKKSKRDDAQSDEGLLKIMEQNLCAINKLSQPGYKNPNRIR